MFGALSQSQQPNPAPAELIDALIATLAGQKIVVQVTLPRNASENPAEMAAPIQVAFEWKYYTKSVAWQFAGNVPEWIGTRLYSALTATDIVEPRSALHAIRKQIAAAVSEEESTQKVFRAPFQRCTRNHRRPTHWRCAC